MISKHQKGNLDWKLQLTTLPGKTNISVKLTGIVFSRNFFFSYYRTV